MIEKIEKLLRLDIINDNNEVAFTDEAKTLIHEIAIECKKSPLYNKEITMEQADEYRKQNLSAEDIYIDMLRKVINAPTAIHMKMSMELLIPLVDEKLNG